MLTENIILYGDTSNKARFLKEETGLFNRILDVYITGGIIGVLFNKKGKNAVDENKVTIFAEQVNHEAMRIKYLASLAFLVENFDTQYNEQDLLKLAFGDWFANVKNEDNVKDKDKYFLFKLYAIGGIDILYQNIIGQSTEKEGYLRNYYNFLKQLENLNLSDNLERIIGGALMDL